MNSTFRVVFNKARGALMVVNEITSCVQAKGTKTVVATAAALMVAGVAQAAEPSQPTETPQAPETVVTNYVDQKGMTSAEYVELKKKAEASGASEEDKNAFAEAKADMHLGAFMYIDKDTKKLDSYTFKNNSFEMKRGLVKVSNGATLEVANSTFEGNTTAFGQINNYKGKLVVDQSVFKNNTARANGGAVYSTDGETTITNTSFEGNKATGVAGGGKGGAVAVSGGKLTLTNVDFTKNSGQLQGGGLWLEKGEVTAKNVNYVGNTALDNNGGAINITGSGTYTQDGGVISGNSAKKNGGAISISDGNGVDVAKVEIKNATIKNNTAGNGGALFLHKGTATFTDTVFSGNTALGWGGALYVKEGTVNLNVTDGKNLVYAGNKGGTKLDDGVMKNYGHAGDFMYLQGDKSTANFNVGNNASLTIKDSILSQSISGQTVSINKEGTGTLTVADLKGFIGNLNVNAGKVVVEGGIGEFDIVSQINANDNKTIGLSATNVKVGAQGTLELGDVVVNRVVNGGAGTIFDVTDGGSLTMNSLTVTSSEYKNRKEPAQAAANDPAQANQNKFVGLAQVKGDTTIKNGLKVDKGATFDIESGVTTVSGTSVNEGKITLKDNAGLDLAAGTMTNKGQLGDMSGANGELTIAAGATLNNQATIGVKDLIVDGTLTTNMFEKMGEAGTQHVKFASVTLNDGGKFVINNIKDNQAGFTDGTVNLNGGHFYDKDKVFTGDITTGQQATVNQNGGDYTYGKLTVGGTANLNAGKLTAESLNVASSATASIGNETTVKGDVKIEGNTSVTETGTLTLNGNKVLANSTEKQNLTNNGTLVLDGLKGEYDKTAIDNLFADPSKNTGIVDIGNATIKNVGVKDGKIAYNDVKNLGGLTNEALKKAQVTGVNGALAGSFNSVALAEKGALTVDDKKTLELNGTGKLVAAADGKLAGAKVDGTLATTGDGAQIGDLTGKGTLVVKSGDLTVNKVELGKAIVAGDLKVNELSVTDGTVTGNALVTKLTKGTVFAGKAGTTVAMDDAALVAVGTLEKDAKLHAGHAGIIAVGTTDKAEILNGLKRADVSALGADEYQSAVFVKADAKNSIAGSILANDADTASTNMTNVEVGSESLMVIAGGDRKGTTAVFGSDLTNNGDLMVLDARKGEKLKLAATVTGNGSYLVEGDRILTVTNDKGTLSFDIAKKENIGALNGMITGNTVYDYFNKGLNGTGTKSDQFNSFLMSKDNGLTDAQVAAVANAGAMLGVTAGMGAVTMDALNSFNDAIDARTSMLTTRGEGVNLWVDVHAGRNKATELMDGAGYKSDLYAGVFGVDTTVSCGAVVGAALTFGKADTDSENALIGTSMDSDFIGLSLYTSKALTDKINFSANLGYMQGKNDVTVQGYGLGEFSADTTAWTLGARGEYLAYEGVVNVIPHVGFRYTRLSTDSFEAAYETSFDDQNIFQMPIGVSVAGNMDFAGWKVVPAADLSIVPTFGDKDATMTLGLGSAIATKHDVQVVDSNPVQLGLGVDAQKGAWGFGVEWKLGAGSDDRLNNAFHARVNYAF